MIPAVVFVKPVPILGTSERRDAFEAADGWHITEESGGVRLSRCADPVKQTARVPSFIVRGVGYCVPYVVAVDPSDFPDLQTYEMRSDPGMQQLQRPAIDAGSAANHRKRGAK